MKRRSAISVVVGFTACASLGAWACVGDEPLADSGGDSGFSDGSADGNAGDAASDSAADAGPCGAASSDGVDCGGGLACYHGVCDGKRPIKVVAIESHACALLKSGDVWCWGKNQFGEIGVPVDAGQTISHATQVNGITGVIDISGSAVSTCALKSDGSVWCWGYNHEGELAHDPNLDPRAVSGQEYNPLPTQAVAPANSAVSALASSQFSTCAITNVGHIICWGDPGTYNLFDQADAGSGAPSFVPVYAANFGPTTVPNVDAVYGQFGSHYAAHTSDGTLWSWGANVAGERGNTDPSGSLASPATFADGGVVSDFGVASVGSQGVDPAGATCATRDGGLWCWGDNTDGYFGSSLPTSAAPALSQAGPFSMVSGIYRNACGITPSHDVYCWARGTQGEIGNGVTGADGGPGTVTCDSTQWCTTGPVQVPGMKAVYVSAGVNFAVAILEDGSLRAWGQNDYAQLGHQAGALGDSTSCGGPTSCNGVPQIVEGLPALP